MTNFVAIVVFLRKAEISWRTIEHVSIDQNCPGTDEFLQEGRVIGGELLRYRQ